MGADLEIETIKMKTLLLICGLVALSAAAPTAVDLEWIVFKGVHGKSYANEMEEAIRKSIFEENKKYIDQHNAEFEAGLHTFTLGVNQFTDMATSEVNGLMNGYVMPKSRRATATFVELDNTTTLPTTVDWRTKGAVTKVKNQGQCGSCWAFSTTGSLEGQHAIKKKALLSFSEQQLVDCDTIDFGCDGGLMTNAFTYIIRNKGIDTEASYPYQAVDGAKCLYKPQDIGATMTAYKTIPTGDENALQAAVANVGPISVGIDASQESFQLYQKGVYYEPDCSSQFLDHGVLAVGYGTTDADDDNYPTVVDYWLVKNSWGTTWGMEGYIQMSRNRKNNCGIATMASYPVV